MMTKTGYETPPAGRLLDQLIDLKGLIGIVHERSVGFEKSIHTHDRHLMVCPRGSCRMDVRDSSGKVYKLDSTKILWVPRNIPHSDHAQSSIYDVFALFPNWESSLDMIKDNGLSESDRLLIEQDCHLVKRTKWLDDLLARYFYERVASRFSPPGCTYFLEKQIMNEFARILFDRKLRESWNAVTEADEKSDVLETAIRFIETKLFDRLTGEQIAASAKTSISTLARLFREQVGQTPSNYIKKRRLDEARHLIKKGEHAIGDVALLVGYEDFSAFSRAFAKEFGASPRSFVPSPK